MSTPTSSSSSRTMYGKLSIKEEYFKSGFNLDHLEIPDSTSIQSLGFLDGPEEEIFPEPTPLSPKTISLRNEIVRSAEEVLRVEFMGNTSLTCTSVYVVRPISCDSLRSWVDPVWFMPEFEMQGIPFVYFEYGLRLPLHPFHLDIYEALGCGVVQITPNFVA